jgi:hypothetical protein
VETASGQAWLDVVAQYGQRFDMTSEESLTLPAAETPTLRYAARPEDGP